MLAGPLGWALACCLVIASAGGSTSSYCAGTVPGTYPGNQPAPKAPQSPAEPQAQEVTAPSPVPDVVSTRLAQGDFLLVNLFDGKESWEYRSQVDGVGDLTLPLVGAVSVAGLALHEAAAKLTEAYREFYVNPNLSLQILQLGQFEVFAFGADVPGQIITLPNNSRLLDILKELELDASGAYRRLHLLRGDFDFGALLDLAQPPIEASPAALLSAAGAGTIEVPSAEITLAGYTNWRAWVVRQIADPACQVWVVDPLDLIVEGELSEHNITLLPHDVLYIPAPENFVDIYGVAKIGRYELLAGDTLGSILRIAGTPDYRNDLANAIIQRYDASGCLERLIFNLYPGLDDLDLIEQFELRNRDVISFMPRESRIFVMGEVKLAGAFPFLEDSTVLDYIALAGGETDEAHLTWLAIIRSTRNRLDPYAEAEVIQANFKRIAKGLPLCTDISLLPGDVIYVPPKGERFQTAQLIQVLSAALTSYATLESNSKTTTTDSGGGSGDPPTP